MSDTRTAAERIIPSDLDHVSPLQQEIEEALQSCEYGDRDVFFIRLCVEEAVVNAIKHGNQLDPDKRVRVWYSVSPDRFSIRIEDEGAGFNPAEVPDPTMPENLDRPCGRGVHLIRSFMTVVEYGGRGNIVTMTKVRNGTPE